MARTSLIEVPSVNHFVTLIVISDQFIHFTPSSEIHFLSLRGFTAHQLYEIALSTNGQRNKHEVHYVLIIFNYTDMYIFLCTCLHIMVHHEGTMNENVTKQKV